MDSRKLWSAVLGELELNVSRASFKTWFKQTSLIANEDGHIVVAVPNIFTKERLEKKYHSDIKEILTKMNTPVESIEYKITSNLEKTKALYGQDELLAPIQQTAPTVTKSKKPTNQGSSQLNTKYTFESFVIGPSNELAYAASKAVADNPGGKYNPLFLYGGVGLGKTHLMQAVGNEILRRDPSKKIAYVTSEDFTRQFLDSISSKGGKKFADKYRNLDVLIIDDVQFLGKKERTQEEFFHTFNTLHQANKQVILSSDQPPKTIPNLEDRLRSRLEWSMVADIQKPDLETREAIIQRKAAARGVSLPMDVVEYLARHYQHNIRELEGSLTSILAQCELKNLEPSLNFISGLLGASVQQKKRAISPKMIIEKTAIYFNLQASDIIGPRRDKDIVVPRQIAMFLMRSELGLSYPKIAAQVGGRDHTTAMHSVTKIEKLIELDSQLRAEISNVKERIKL